MGITATSRRCRRASTYRPIAPRLLLLLTTLAACESRVTLVDPTSGPPTDTTGTVQRATLEVRVVAEPADRGVADALGATDGRIAGAEVTITRQGSSARVVDTADANGVARFTDLLPGTWAVSALRPLTAAEVSNLPAGDRDVTAFAGGTQRALGNGEAGVLELRALAGRRGSLVISQLMPSIPLGPDGNNYNSGEYVRIYNNSDTTVYLDGKSIAHGLYALREYDAHQSCAAMEQWRLDSLGQWARFIYRFPGRGTDHPLLPGTAVTLATDAIDHRVANPGLADLSRAEFEFRGPKDVDNPSAVNMLSIGPAEYDPLVIGTGLRFYNADRILILADFFDTTAVARVDMAGIAGFEFWRIPRARILDVMVVIATPALEATRRPLCERLTHPSFDRQAGGFFGPEPDIYSIVRKPFSLTAEGRVVLQRTRTTSQDFYSVPGSDMH